MFFTPEKEPVPFKLSFARHRLSLFRDTEIEVVDCSPTHSMISSARASSDRDRELGDGAAVNVIRGARRRENGVGPFSDDGCKRWCEVGRLALGVEERHTQSLGCSLYAFRGGVLPGQLTSEPGHARNLR